MELSSEIRREAADHPKTMRSISLQSGEIQQMIEYAPQFIDG